MNDLRFLDLNKLTRWGHAIHGLALIGGASAKYQAGGAEFQLPGPVALSLVDATVGIPVEDQGNTHLVKVPGIAAVDITEEEAVAEAQQGRFWQNYALLSGAAQALAGAQLKGWVCIAPDGGRWLIQPAGTPSLRYGSTAAGGPLTLQLNVRPFGRFEAEPVAPITVAGTLADIGQADPPGISAPNGAMLAMRIASIASHGRSVLIALMPTKTVPADVRDLPYGWLRLDLIGNGPNFAVSLSVLCTRAEALGDIDHELSSTIQSYRITPKFQGTVLVEERDANGQLLHGEATYQTTGFAVLRVGEPGWQYGYSTTNSYFSIGAHTGYSYMRNRLVAVTFNELDQVVRTSVDWEMDSHFTYEQPDLQAQGQYKLVTGSAVPGERSGAMSVNITLAGSGTYNERVRLKRDGVELSLYEFTVPASASYSYTVDLGMSQEWLNSRTSLVFSPVGATAQYMIGGPDPANGIPIGTHWARTLTVKLDDQVQESITDHDRAWATVGLDQLPVMRIESSNVLNLDDYLRVDCTAFRLCNHVAGLRYERYEDGAATALPEFAKSLHLVATSGGRWTNPRSGTDPVDRTRMTASYHPITYALHVDLDWSESNRARGTWI
ncbi:hypothetical protein IB256_04030 [Pseudomonas sp. PDM17]|uniref:hypothetical protein n=1 Tax=Pseudomonas sp. PDM17 TaxID=2769285 RepID=UPI001780F05C|nr:hypothetical protein [Pseudomonas sp. PDM17]MBD9499935.1 hypothetical protein [Pseudomonas sp. PDM17]